MKFKVGDKVRYNREFLVDRLETGNGFRYTGIEGFNIIEISEKEVKSEDGFWFYKDQLELIPEESEFEYGEEIEVTNDGNNWLKRIFITKSKECRYVCVDYTCHNAFKNGRQYTVAFYNSARKSIPQLTRKEIANRFGVSENFILIDDINEDEIQSRRQG